MNITRRLFTYPVLSEEKDDYKESVFQVDFSHRMEGANTLRLSFSIKMDCPEIDDMISDGSAEYVIHMECSRTAFRQIKRTISKCFDIDIPINRISGPLEIVALIIIKKDIKEFNCSDWSDDFAGFAFSIKHGSIIGYQNLPELNITKDYEEFANADSIFTVYKKFRDEKHFDVNLDFEKIRIGLPTADYDVYARYANSFDLQPILNSMLILPAMVYIFEELKQEGGEETYHNREWYMAIEKAYRKRGLVFQEEVNRSDKTSIELAQEAMDYPFSSALLNIPKFYEIAEED